MSDMKLPSSFRDPSGFMFYQNGALYRQINSLYQEHYDHLINSGLYETLVDAELLVPHEEVNIQHTKSDKAYKVIKPELIPFMSYPYEWCFSQLKDAALTTLEIQKIAFDFGMVLKDASAYNIQFKRGKPILIDTLSFEMYYEGDPWIAYRQFCQHFFAPLTLMSYTDFRLNQLLKIYIDGLPLDLVSSLLPFSSRFRFSVLSHIHLHARSQKHYSNKTGNTKSRKMNRLSFLGLIDNLESATKKLEWQPEGTEWADYYSNTNYSSEAFINKKQQVAQFLDQTRSNTVWDIGANLGVFSRIASGKGKLTISSDIDPAAVERNYLECVKTNEPNLLPLVIDLTNPSPSIGWNNRERDSLVDRGPADTVLALALVHHLAISNNLPLIKIAEFLSRICRDSLIIEFVPKSDSQVQRLLSSREDIFPDYTQQMFESEFEKYFIIENSAKSQDSERLLYLMNRRV